MPVEEAYEELLREVGFGWHHRDLVEGFIALGREGRLPFQQTG